MNLEKKIIPFLKKIPYVRDLYSQVMLYKSNSCYPPGHFYSPIVSVDEMKKRQEEIWPHEHKDEIEGIKLNADGQKDLVKEFVKYYSEIPFTAEKTDYRYYFENSFYSYSDAIFLYSMIRHHRPKQIIEIGSGFSSAVMLDTNSLFFDNSINLTFIEPFPERLNSLLNDGDRATTTILEKKVQDVELEVFEKLNSGDILFIDSTHVAKTGSDVNYIFFEILPRLKNGVFIHFHDIFFPFEYPKVWVLKGRNWNEDYFLRTFLMYNNEFEIVLFSQYLHTKHKEIFKEMPLSYKNFGGNFWMRKNNNL